MRKPGMEPYQDSHLIIEPQERRVELDGKKLQLTRKEFELLALLVSHSGVTVPRAAILQLVWGYKPGVRTRTLDVHIRRLRKHFGVYARQYIEAICGVGYRFQPDRSQQVLEAGAARSAAATDTGAGVDGWEGRLTAQHTD